jgi:hypothetical protein
VEFLVLFAFFGLSAGAIGKLKGSSFVIWFLIGFSTFGFGILAAIFMPFERGELLRRCEECSNVVRLSDQVCMRCGRDLDFPEEALAPEGAAPAR